MIQMAHLTTAAPLLLVVSGVPLLPVEPLPLNMLLPFPPSDGMHEPPGRPTQLFGLMRGVARGRLSRTQPDLAQERGRR